MANQGPSTTVAAARPWIFTLADAALFVAVVGAILMPLVPIWSGIYLLVSLAWLLPRLTSGLLRTSFGMAMLAGSLVYVAAWFGGIAAAPARQMVNAFLYVFGLPVSLWAAWLGLALQLLILAALGAHIWPRAGRLGRPFVIACISFGIWAIVSALAAVLQGRANEPDAVITGTAVWVGWASLGLLGLGASESENARARLLTGYVIGASILALGMLAQIALADFSYVLVSPDPAAFFERVRGSYYYHAPPVQMLAAIVPLALVMRGPSGRHRWIGPLIAIVLAVVVVLNSTRGISFAMIAGMLFMLLAMIIGRRIITAAIAAAVAATLLSQVYYVKPGSLEEDPISTNLQMAQPAPPTVIVEAEPVAEPAPTIQSMPPATEAVPAPAAVAPPAETPSVESFTASNGMRAGLGEAGLGAILEQPLFGSGAANASLLLPGGHEYETSSHMLLVDMGIMTGLPGLIAILAILGIPSIAAASSLLLRDRQDGLRLRAALATVILIFTMTTLFHPQERSEIIALMFLLAGVTISTLRNASVARETSLRLGRPGQIGAWGAGLLALGFSAWLVISSASYVFPAIEFLARYHGQITAEKTPILTNSPLLADALRWGMAITKTPDTVRVVEDVPEALDVDDAFIIWSPSRERQYPRLRAALGFPREFRYGQWMGLAMQPRWWMLDSYQPNIQFLKVGPFPGVPVAPRGMERVAVAAGQTLTLPLSEPLLSGLEADFSLHGDPAGTATLETGHSQQSMEYGQLTTAPLPTTGDSVLLSNPSVDGALEVVAYPKLNPSIAPFLTVRAWIGGIEVNADDTHLLIDASDGAGFWWTSDRETVIEFSGQGAGPVAYRLKTMFDGLQPYKLPERWTIEGRGGEGEWRQIEKRVMIDDASSEPALLTEAALPFDTIRFTFPATTDAANARRHGLREIELYPADAQ